jgi:integrase
MRFLRHDEPPSQDGVETMAVWIRRRVTRNGEARFHVVFQASSYAKQRHLGAFKTLREAKLRRDWALREVAAGRVPDRLVIYREPERVSIERAAGEYLATRLDAAENTRTVYEARARVLVAAFGRHDLSRVTARDVQAWVNEQAAAGLSRSTIHGRIGLLAQILAHASLDAAPARAVRLPRGARPRMRLPSRADLAALYAALPARFAEPVEFLERTGLAVSELVALRWEDVDVERGRILVASGKTPARRRWVDLEAPPLETAVEPEQRHHAVRAARRHRALLPPRPAAPPRVASPASRVGPRAHRG